MAIQQRFLDTGNILKNKHGQMITSTPIKEITSQQLESLWPSTAEQSIDAFSNLRPLVITHRSIYQKYLDLKQRKRFKKSTDALTTSVDKIYPTNQILRADSENGDSVSKDVNIDLKNNEMDRLKLMDSNEKLSKNESAFLYKKNFVSTKSNSSSRSSSNSSYQSFMGRSTPPLSKSKNLDSDYGNQILSNKIMYTNKNTSSAVKPVDRLQKKEISNIPSENVVQISKTVQKDNLIDDSKPSKSIEPFKKNVKRKRKSNESVPCRRSIRRRCKPLEFWNGERMTIERELAGDVRYNKSFSTIPKVANSQKSKKNLINKTSKKENKKSLNLRSTKNGNTVETKVKSSGVAPRTTQNKPANVTNTKLESDWWVNYDEICRMRKHPIPNSIPKSETCIILPGLNVDMDTISSAFMKIYPKTINKNQAPKFHHLIFCVMKGTVKVTIQETSVKMKTYGHFAVPCGNLYIIENIGKQMAILSFFTIAFDTTK